MTSRTQQPNLRAFVLGFWEGLSRPATYLVKMEYKRAFRSILSNQVVRPL